MSKPPSWAAPLGASIGSLLGPTLAARGLGQASLVTHWPEIVGNAIAAYARPFQLQWPPRGGKRDPDDASAPATLVLRIDGAFALEAQHAAATIVAVVPPPEGMVLLAVRTARLQDRSIGAKV